MPGHEARGPVAEAPPEGPGASTRPVGCGGGGARLMFCSEKPGGWQNKAGQPCRQVVSNDPSVVACIHHRNDPESVKAMQRRGGYSFAASLKVKRGAVADTEPDLTLGTVAEIDAEIVKALEALRRGRLAERKAEVLIASLQKLRAAKVEERAAGPAAVPNVQIVSWTPPATFCARCSCSGCQERQAAHRRMVEANRHRMRDDGVGLPPTRPPMNAHPCPASPDGKHVVMPRADEWPPATEGAMFWCESCDQRVRLRESDDGARIVHGAQDETPEEAAARWR